MFKRQTQSSSMNAYDQALRWLGQREYSYHELKLRLERVGYCSEEVQKTLKTVCEYDYQSDERFCMLYLQSCLQRHQGPVKIKQGLKTRGIAKTLIDETLNQQAIDWNQRAIVALNQRFSGIEELNNLAQVKCLRFLANRGFSTEQCYYALRHFASSQ